MRYGAFFIVTGFVRPLQLSALTLASVSVVAFIALSFIVGGYNVHPARVVLADWVALALLLMGFSAYALSLRQKGVGHGNADQY